ncbi:MAG: ferrous iron transporter B [Anaerolineaceae bacterium]
MRIALIGQPNCGKSTLFNQVAGYKAETGNFSGTTVSFTESKVRVSGEVIQLVDLPGTHSLDQANPAEGEALRYLGSHEIDAIVNVVDATHLPQGLELTLELLALDKPVILALNMMDEVARMGMTIDGPGLERKLKIPVLPLVASKGRGVKALFLAALRAAREKPAPRDPGLIAFDPAAAHKLSAVLAGKFVKQGERRLLWRDRLDDILLHPVWGYFALLLILFGFFEAVYGIGKALELPIMALFNRLSIGLSGVADPNSLVGELLYGVIQGFSGGVAIVLPYLVPFLMGLGLLEDIGYLPRIAFLMDSLMHRMGLHGKAIVPFILGYGCNVPAVMSTRILEERKDRLIAATLAVMVPCAARLSVIFGLVAFYLGPLWALVIYLFNMFVIALVGRLLTRLLPEDSPGLILEMPAYRVPTARAVVNKAWFRVREFIVEAWPLLIAGSAVLALMGYFKMSPAIDTVVRPFTWLLGLPAKTGVPLIFGILRKELSMIMLAQAFGVSNFSAILSPQQMMTYTVFVVFYIPCLPTLSALRRELGWRVMGGVAGLTVVVALVVGVFTRLVGLIFT